MGIVTLTDIEAAARRIEGRIRRTPVDLSPSLSDRVGVPVHLKHEHRQITGAFKLRGATNALLQLTPEQRAKGVTAASTGNHGRALAHAAAAEGVRCIVCMSALVPRNKLDAIAALGAETRIVGRSQDEAQIEVDRLVAEEGLTNVPPFDHPAIVAGQGTIGLEIVADLPDVETVLVPLSGGGLVAGIAAAVKGLRPDVRVIAISMRRGAAMQASLAAGHPVEVEELPTFADSLGGGIGLGNAWTFEAVRSLVDEVVLLDEAEIAAGIRHAYAEEREIVEGAAAVGIAALLAGKVRPNGPTLALLSGRNIDMQLHRAILNGANTLEEAA
ncbi:hydroxyectoine utilization dehydratase EutB [Aurantimonas coralicida]|uniref:hydroxyectoine utilization dehydratase EutB n=1 Tax=Aurantimonas coralicida TaxID=182270 RepID=UPI001D196610|nr:hydroxyectoine utilization dehydratase EutB [Aurantimonas coralicida]MCC4299102.1 hydroxyectoine utilization dehydratase EutB [Aurantimonas coralicida]